MLQLGKEFPLFSLILVMLRVASRVISVYAFSMHAVCILGGTFLSKKNSFISNLAAVHGRHTGGSDTLKHAEHVDFRKLSIDAAVIGLLIATVAIKL